VIWGKRKYLAQRNGSGLVPCGSLMGYGVGQRIRDRRAAIRKI
jgi:hypothetical protein